MSEQTSLPLSWLVLLTTHFVSQDKWVCNRITLCINPLQNKKATTLCINDNLILVIWFQSENARLEEANQKKDIDLQQKDNELQQKDEALREKDAELQRVQRQLLQLQVSPSKYLIVCRPSSVISIIQSIIWWAILLITVVVTNLIVPRLFHALY